MNTKSNKFAGVGILTAVAASLCCITPVLALVSGASGIASSLSWIEPFRPYLIGFTVLVLSFAWFQKLKPEKATGIDCACEEEEKQSFWQTKTFLGFVTIFAIIMIAFPYYGQIFYQDNDPRIAIVSSENIQELTLNVSGMTCDGCEDHVEHTLVQLTGVIRVTASYSEELAEVEFDVGQTDKKAIIDAINSTGYKVEDEAGIQDDPPHGEPGHVCGPDGCN